MNLKKLQKIERALNLTTENSWLSYKQEKKVAEALTIVQEEKEALLRKYKSQYEYQVNKKSNEEI